MPSSTSIVPATAPPFFEGSGARDAGCCCMTGVGAGAGRARGRRRGRLLRPAQASTDRSRLRVGLRRHGRERRLHRRRRVRRLLRTGLGCIAIVPRGPAAPACGGAGNPSVASAALALAKSSAGGGGTSIGAGGAVRGAGVGGTAPARGGRMLRRCRCDPRQRVHLAQRRRHRLHHRVERRVMRVDLLERVERAAHMHERLVAAREVLPVRCARSGASTPIASAIGSATAMSSSGTLRRLERVQRSGE